MKNDLKERVYNIFIKEMENIKVHPIYKNYGVKPETNQIINIEKKFIIKTRLHASSYIIISLMHNDKQKTYSEHRFIWECYNDIIPKGYEIDHINHNRVDNSISNLRCITVNQNRKNRDHTNILKIAKIAHTLKRFIKAINKDDENITFDFISKNQCAKYLNISPAMVYLISQNKLNVKYANTNQGKVYFKYTDDNNITNLIKLQHGNIGNKFRCKNQEDKIIKRESEK